MIKNKIAFILECNIDRSLISSYGFGLQKKSSQTNFGKVEYYELLKKNSIKAIIFENAGMNSKFTLPQTSLPIFSTLFKNNIKNVFLLGFTGSLKKINNIGSFVIPNDFIDFTKNRKRSFIEELKPGQLFFYRMAKPFNPQLNKLLKNVAKKFVKNVFENAILAVTEGPHFETASEINFYRRSGCDCVCFSGIPDVYFARELNINYAIGLFVSNFGEGIHSSQLDKILNIAKSQIETITNIVVEITKSKLEKINFNHHLKYWMQKPDDSVYRLIK